MAQDEKEQPAYLVQLSTNIGGGRQLNITTNLARGVSLLDAHAEVDKIVAIVGRQQLHVGIADREGELQATKDQLSFFEAQLSTMDALKEAELASGGPRSKTQLRRDVEERQKREHITINVTTLREKVKSLQAAIDLMKNDFSMTLTDQAAE